LKPSDMISIRREDRDVAMIFLCRDALDMSYGVMKEVLGAKWKSSLKNEYSRKKDSVLREEVLAFLGC
jgi:hypothetical protein